jgi:hypothetical protein
MTPEPRMDAATRRFVEIEIDGLRAAQVELRDSLGMGRYHDAIIQERLEYIAERIAALTAQAGQPAAEKEG